MPALISPHEIRLSQALRIWLKIGLLSFGGPAGQIALMHRILVDELRWIGERRFLHALNYCMLLPGPEAMQLATYIGWLLHGTAGGLAAGLLFVLPGALVMLGLSVLYAVFQQVGWMEALFFGLKAAVLVIVIEALLRVGKRALKNRLMVMIAVAAFVGIFFLAIPFPVIVLLAALFGAIGGRLQPGRFAVLKSHEATGTTADSVVDRMFDSGRMAHVSPGIGRQLVVLVVWLALWSAPIALTAALLGLQDIYTQLGVFFSKMAVVTFGGAYAVLAYVAQEAVTVQGWLAPGEMLDGLGLAETTPGPLILVLQYVGFLAAFRDAVEIAPLLAGVLGALMTLWVTFTPCFLWIFLGAPYVEKLQNRPALTAALSSITAAVVGVILNLALWFGLHTLFGSVEAVRRFGLTLQVPDPATLNLASLLLSLLAGVMLLYFKLGIVRTLMACCAIGLALRMF